MPTNVDSVTTTSIRTLDKTRKVDNDLGKDAFLQILVAQMANQDPLSPTSDTEFIAQMAQFSSLEQMQNMNASMQTQMTYSYLGKDVASNFIVDGDGNLYRQDVLGVVEAVVKRGGKDYLQVHDYYSGESYLVPPDQVSATMGGGIESMLAKLYELLNKVVENTTPPKAEGETGEDGGKTEGVEGSEGAQTDTETETETEPQAGAGGATQAPAAQGGEAGL